MPCTPDYCDIHDYPVAPGGGWCRAVDAAYARTQNAPGLGSNNTDLDEAMFRLGDILERFEERQPNWSPPPTAPQPKREQRKGGTPL